jgi:hypothetical protein
MPLFTRDVSLLSTNHLLHSLLAYLGSAVFEKSATRVTSREQRVMIYHELRGADKMNQGYMPYQITSKPLDSRRLLADMPRYERNVGAR